MTYIIVVATALLLLAATLLGPSLIAQIRPNRQQPNLPVNPPVAGAPAPAAPAVRTTATQGSNSLGRSIARGLWRITVWAVGILVAILLVGVLIQYKDYWTMTIAILVLGAFLLIPAWFGARKLLKDAGSKISVGIFILVALGLAWMAWDSIARGPMATRSSIQDILERYAQFIGGQSSPAAGGAGGGTSAPVQTAPISVGAERVRHSWGAGKPVMVATDHPFCVRINLFADSQVALQRHLRGTDPRTLITERSGTFTQEQSLAQVITAHFNGYLPVEFQRVACPR